MSKIQAPSRTKADKPVKCLYSEFTKAPKTFTCHHLCHKTESVLTKDKNLTFIFPDGPWIYDHTQNLARKKFHPERAKKQKQEKSHNMLDLTKEEYYLLTRDITNPIIVRPLSKPISKPPFNHPSLNSAISKSVISDSIRQRNLKKGRKYNSTGFASIN